METDEVWEGIMYDLKNIDLGKDEAEQDNRLKEYFLKTSYYEAAINGTKTIIIGRKGSGKSAIFSSLEEELEIQGTLVVTITPDQYSWGTLKEYREAGITLEQAHTNAWKLTLLSSIIWKLYTEKKISPKSKLSEFIKYMNDSFKPDIDNAFHNFSSKVMNILGKVKTQWVSFDWGDSATTPLRIIEEITNILVNEWPAGVQIRILIDRIDDCWDASEGSKNLIIGLLKASNSLNAIFNSKTTITVFIRSDIYSNLYFHDQDKLRQYEATLFWNAEELKSIVTERVRVSLNLSNSIDSNEIWNNLFSKKLYRSKASAEKYIIDRTFKRPRDIISFVRFSLEVAIKNNSTFIEPVDTRISEEENYSHSKYKDLIIEYEKQRPYIKNLLDSLSGTLHKQSKEQLMNNLEAFKNSYRLEDQPLQLLRYMFEMGVIGVKRQGRAGIRQRGGAKFYYYYDDTSINPLSYTEFYVHPSLRHYLNITESRG